MSRARLISYSSILPSSPSFVIPIFSIFGSNASYVQDLTLDGLVKEFKVFESENFITVPVISVDMYVNINSPGITAYWASEHEVWVGSFEYLKGRIAELDEEDIHPFIAVEAMTFLGDATRLRRAADRASRLITKPSAASAYQSGILSRAAFMRQISENQGEVSKIKPDADLDHVLNQLRSDLTEGKWFSLWLESWRRFNHPSVLFGILRWKIDSGFSVAFQADCVSRLVSNGSLEYISYATQWLEKNHLAYSGWPSVWFALIERSSSDNPRLNDLAIKFLYGRVLGQAIAQIDHQWCRIWSRLWRNNQHHHELVEIAMGGATQRIRHSDSFVKFVIKPLRKQIGSAEWTTEYLFRWLSVPQPNTIWVDTYIDMYGEFSETPTYRRSGVEWLQRLGAGMNLWADMWRIVQQFEAPAVCLDLAFSWLARARKDISSWPIVFEEAFKLMGNRSSPELEKAAQLWVAATHHSRRSNKLIRAIADGDLA